MALKCFVPSGAHSRDQHNDPDDDDDDLHNDWEMDTDEMHDYEDQDPHSSLTSTAKLGPYASFLQNLSDMTQEKFDKAFKFKALSLPSPGPLP